MKYDTNRTAKNSTRAISTKNNHAIVRFVVWITVAMVRAIKFTNAMKYVEIEVRITMGLAPIF